MKPYKYIYIYLHVIICKVINLWKHVKNLISLMSTPTEVLNYLKLLKDELQGK